MAVVPLNILNLIHESEAVDESDYDMSEKNI